MQLHYFNTGVKPWNSNGLNPGEKWNEHNEKLIPFETDEVPNGSTFKFACDNPELYPNSDYLIVKIHSGLFSQYAYFSKPYNPNS